MVSPVKSRFIRCPEDIRLLRQYILHPNTVDNILYIGGATGEDLLSWFPATYGAKVQWWVSELQYDAKIQLERVCEDHGALLFFEDFRQTLRRHEFDVIVGNYFMHLGWDAYKREILEAVLEHGASLIFLRDCITIQYHPDKISQYTQLCKRYNYQVLEHPEHLDAQIDGCKRRDTGYILLKNDVTFIPDKYTTLIETREVVDATV